MYLFVIFLFLFFLFGLIHRVIEIVTSRLLTSVIAMISRDKKKIPAELQISLGQVPMTDLCLACVLFQTNFLVLLQSRRV